MACWRKIENGKSPVNKTYPRGIIKENTRVIGASVRQRITHMPEDFRRRFS
jgi:hypothetical protein